MAIEKSRLIPEQLRVNEAFLTDLTRFAAAPPGLLSNLAEVAAQPYAPIPEARLRELAEQSDLTTTDVYRIYAVLNYLRARAVQLEANPSEVLGEVKEVMADQGVSLQSSETELIDIFRVPDEYREESLSTQAFTFGATYLTAELRPAFLPLSNRDDRLHPGYLLSLEYLGSEGNRQSMTFAMSPGELRQLQQQIVLATDQLSRLRLEFFAEDNGG